MDLQLSNKLPSQWLQPLACSSLIKRELNYITLFLVFLISSILIFNFVNPFDSQTHFRFDILSKILPRNREPRLETCDYSNGRWVRDESYHLQSYSEECPFLDPGFQCHRNGRKSQDFLKWRWQPSACNLPRFNSTDFLERSRNGRIVFAGDSIGRNQWESLLCMLSQAVSNKSTVYEEHGSPISKHKGYLSFRFLEYNLTVEYYRVPLLVAIGRPPPNSPSEVRGAIRLDELHWYSKQWVGADVLVFNTGHWWNEDKTAKLGFFFEERGVLNTTMDVLEAYRRSLETWKSWVLKNLESEKSHVFFRSYSPVHYRNGSWKEGGSCDNYTEPETNYTKLQKTPIHDHIIANIIQQIGNQFKVRFLNITYLTEFRFDGHPSKFREPGTAVDAPQDCSHWCLPGVPDTWNELLYAYLLSREFRTK